MVWGDVVVIEDLYSKHGVVSTHAQVRDDQTAGKLQKNVQSRTVAHHIEKLRTRYEFLLRCRSSRNAFLLG